eukprot:TRINITY_DN21425_c0_g2_i1.p1 TRINITY_DN21425_c0_g2~~TRINITY_DN21425_c0_g2_i1.p1  ORF type:complete len:907 (+),score=118.39 TRINITY_DN21425_c0_g2_i1:52-2772(+)
MSDISELEEVVGSEDDRGAHGRSVRSYSPESSDNRPQRRNSPLRSDSRSKHRGRHRSRSRSSSQPNRSNNQVHKPERDDEYEDEWEGEAQEAPEVTAESIVGAFTRLKIADIIPLSAADVESEVAKLRDENSSVLQCYVREYETNSLRLSAEVCYDRLVGKETRHRNRISGEWVREWRHLERQYRQRGALAEQEALREMCVAELNRRREVKQSVLAQMSEIRSMYEQMSEHVHRMDLVSKEASSIDINVRLFSAPSTLDAVAENLVSPLSVGARLCSPMRVEVSVPAAVETGTSPIPGEQSSHYWSLADEDTFFIGPPTLCAPQTVLPLALERTATNTSLPDSPLPSGGNSTEIEIATLSSVAAAAGFAALLAKQKNAAATASIVVAAAVTAASTVMSESLNCGNLAAQGLLASVAAAIAAVADIRKQAATASVAVVAAILAASASANQREPVREIECIPLPVSSTLGVELTDTTQRLAFERRRLQSQYEIQLSQLEKQKLSMASEINSLKGELLQQELVLQELKAANQLLKHELQVTQANNSSKAAEIIALLEAQPRANPYHTVDAAVQTDALSNQLSAAKPSLDCELQKKRIEELESEIEFLCRKSEMQEREWRLQHESAQLQTRHAAMEGYAATTARLQEWERLLRFREETLQAEMTAFETQRTAFQFKETQEAERLRAALQQAETDLTLRNLEFDQRTQAFERQVTERTNSLANWDSNLTERESALRGRLQHQAESMQREMQGISFQQAEIDQNRVRLQERERQLWAILGCMSASAPLEIEDFSPTNSSFGHSTSLLDDVWEDRLRLLRDAAQRQAQELALLREDAAQGLEDMPAPHIAFASETVGDLPRSNSHPRHATHVPGHAQSAKAQLRHPLYNRMPRKGSSVTHVKRTPNKKALALK